MLGNGCMEFQSSLTCHMGPAPESRGIPQRHLPASVMMNQANGENELYVLKNSIYENLETGK